jgi:prepilin-type processing-associated H-X9-DG protein
MPFCVALLSSTIQDGTRLAQLVPDYKWSKTEALFPQAQIFRCPAARPMRQGAYYPGWVEGVFEGGPTLYLVTGQQSDARVWYVNVDYATNGGLLGFHYASRFDHRRYRGRLASVKSSAHMVLCADTAGWAPGWIPALTSATRHVTLVDAWQATLEVPYSSSLDLKRHQGMMNVLFVDGHVDLVRIDRQSLSQCDLLQP